MADSCAALFSSTSIASRGLFPRRDDDDDDDEGGVPIVRGDGEAYRRQHQDDAAFLTPKDDDDASTFHVEAEAPPPPFDGGFSERKDDREAPGRKSVLDACLDVIDDDRKQRESMLSPMMRRESTPPKGPRNDPSPRSLAWRLNPQNRPRTSPDSPGQRLPAGRPADALRSQTPRGKTTRPLPALPRPEHLPKARPAATAFLPRVSPRATSPPRPKRMY